MQQNNITKRVPLPTFNQKKLNFDLLFLNLYKQKKKKKIPDFQENKIIIVFNNDYINK